MSGQEDAPRRTSPLPPAQLPVPGDPAFGGEPGPYSASPLRDVCGPLINPHALEYYRGEGIFEAEAGLHCANPELSEWLDTTQGFDPRAQLRQPPAGSWPMTRVLPRLSIWGSGLAFPLQPGSYVVDYRYLTQSRQKLPDRPEIINLKDRFPAGTDLYLSFFGDPDLNWSLWPRIDLWQAPFLDSFRGIIMPDFLAYCNDPIPQSLIGERMVQMFAEEASAAGRTVIPSIAWRDEASLRRQVELWASMYPHVHTIQLDCDGFGVNPTMWWWRWLYAMERYCAGLPHIRFLIAGRVNGWVIGELNRIFPQGNYAVIPSVSLHVGCMSSTRSKEEQAKEFRRRVHRLQAFIDGEETADPCERPPYWPGFADCERQRPPG